MPAGNDIVPLGRAARSRAQASWAGPGAGLRDEPDARPGAPLPSAPGSQPGVGLASETDLPADGRVPPAASPRAPAGRDQAQGASARRAGARASRWRPRRRRRQGEELLDQIGTPLVGCARIAVVSGKGGVGKTTTTAMLGHVLAECRGDRVVVLDGNPDHGTLAARIGATNTSTVTDMLSRAGSLLRYSEVRALTFQASSRLEVVAGDSALDATRALGAEEHMVAIDLLAHHYSIIGVDTGTGMLVSANQAILACSEQMVLVVGCTPDEIRVAECTLDWLDAHGHHRLAAGAICVLNAVRGGSHRAHQAMEEPFLRRTRAVVRIPWDPHLGAGGRARLEDLRPATRWAYYELAGQVAAGFAALPGSGTAGYGTGREEETWQQL